MEALGAFSMMMTRGRGIRVAVASHGRLVEQPVQPPLDEEEGM